MPVGKPRGPAASPPGGLRARAARALGRRRGIAEAGAFTPLLDAKAAGRLLGVPHTWLLAQARMGRIPHHRLGHYVRFNPHDLESWLKDTRQGPPLENGRGGWGT
jgi:excisionase family DNA binding protein